MIVHCPSCSTRYRHQALPPSPLVSAQCSECDEVFPLRTPRRPYVLLPGTSARMAIGMDEPGLAAQVAHRGPEIGEGGALGYTELAAAEIETAEPVFESEDAWKERTQVPAAAAASPAEAWTPAAELEEPAREQEPAEAPVRAVKRPRLAEPLVAVGPACAGAGLAYYFAGGTAGAPWTSLAIGGILGLLVGWGCLRWMRSVD